MCLQSLQLVIVDGYHIHCSVFCRGKFLGKCQQT